jgi:alpha-tubulin suppressor-like RCC1 family protein
MIPVSRVKTSFENAAPIVRVRNLASKRKAWRDALAHSVMVIERAMRDALLPRSEVLAGLRILLTVLVASSCSNGAEPSPLQNAHLTFLTPPGTAEGQVPFDPPVRVALEDANGHIITVADTEVVIALVAQPVFPAGQPPTALRGTIRVRTVMGIATFNDLSLPLPGDGYRLQASTGTMTPVTSEPFSVRLTFTVPSAGGDHSCGLTVAHFVYCWGLNGLGQVGDSTNVSRYIPTPARGRIAFRQVSAGGSHTCGITLDGTVQCWGGVPPGSPSAAPPPLWAPALMPGLSGVDQLSAALVGQFSRSCAVTNAGVVYCWGNYDVPIQESNNPSLRYVSTVGGHTCGLTSDGTAYCWGWNNSGQLGDSTLTDRTAPVPVAGGLRFLAITAGGYHTCGIATDSIAYCWGSNAQGALGDGTNDQRIIPTRVVGNIVFIQLSAGGLFTCGVTKNHAAYCWGYNAWGALGDGSTTSRTVPTPVSGGHSFSAVSAGTIHSCGLASNGVYCWGLSGGGGLLGDGSSGASLVPRRIVQ